MHRIEGLNYTRDSNGNNSFTNGPPATTLPAEFMNSVQEEISTVIENAGFTLKTQATDSTKNQLYTSILQISNASVEHLVTSQAQLNALIERTAANTYKFSDTVRSIYLRRDPTGVGYQMSGTSSFLSGGDTWGQLQTNNCGYIFCESGAFFDAGIERSYITVNTNNGTYCGIKLNGDTGSSAAITNGIDVNADYVHMINCGVTLRNTTAVCNIFEGNSKTTCKFDGCYVTNIISTNTLNCFNQCYNLNNCYIATIDGTSTTVGFNTCYNINTAYLADFDGTGSGALRGFSSSNNISNCYLADFDSVNGSIKGMSLCRRINNCIIYDVESSGSGHIKGCDSCNMISNSYIDQIDCSSGDCYGFDNSTDISSCRVDDLDSTTGSVYGYHDSNQIAASRVEDLDAVAAGEVCRGFDNCDRLSGCLAKQLTGSNTVSVCGFLNCEMLSACTADDLDSSTTGIYGFFSCSNLSACYAFDIAAGSGNTLAIGFHNCDQISGCKANQIDSSGTGAAAGFSTCNVVSACFANDIDSPSGTADGFGLCSFISACYVTNADNGFNSCQYGSSLYTAIATNPSNTYIDTTDAAIGNQFSCHPTNWT